MSKYTTEVRFICETAAGLSESLGFNDVEKILDVSAFKVFDFPFPIFDEAYRKPLVIKILRHYYTREIGFETVGLWKLKCMAHLNDVMPYFNKLYESELLTFDPFRDVDLYREHDRDTQTGETGNENRVDTDKTDGWNLYSETPQGGITGLKNEKYLTNATHDYSDDTRNSKTDRARDFHSEEDYFEHYYGKTAGRTYMEMLKQLRESFLNIDLQVIESMDDLFMMVW